MTGLEIKGEKVDYAILQNGEPVILIEAKCFNKKLEKHDSQLFRYFATTKSKFAILTNGIIYRFYTNLDEVTKMDKEPFLEIDLLNLRKNKNELKLSLESINDIYLFENDIIAVMHRYIHPEKLEPKPYVVDLVYPVVRRKRTLPNRYLKLPK